MRSLLEHGGRIDAAAALYPHAPQPWLDLSTGINPNAWRGRVPPVDDAPLPSVGALAALEQAAATSFGLAAGDIAALPGSELGLRLLRCLDLPKPLRYVAPGYGTHAALPGATPIGIDTIDDEAARGGTILLANPNNPDGRIFASVRVRALAQALRAKGGRLIVDEAFADAVPATSIVPHLTDDDGVLVLRSFGKFFGLAGLRLGFALGARDLVGAYRALLGAWPVSSAALTVGAAAYADTAWIERSRDALGAAAGALEAVLRGHGLAATGACPLFRLVETDDAGALFARLAGQGILTRPFDYAPRWLRFGLPGDDAALVRLDRALAHG